MATYGIAAHGHTSPCVRVCRMCHCMQCKWALQHHTLLYIDAHGCTAMHVAVPYIHVRTASTYGAVRKAGASKIRSKTHPWFDACRITWQIQPHYWPLVAYISVRTKRYRIAKCDANWPLLRLKMPHTSHPCAIQNKPQLFWQKYLMLLQMAID